MRRRGIIVMKNGLVNAVAVAKKHPYNSHLIINT